MVLSRSTSFWRNLESVFREKTGANLKLIFWFLFPQGTQSCVCGPMPRNSCFKYSASFLSFFMAEKSKSLIAQYSNQKQSFECPVILFVSSDSLGSSFWSDLCLALQLYYKTYAICIITHLMHIGTLKQVYTLMFQTMNYFQFFKGATASPSPGLPSCYILSYPTCIIPTIPRLFFVFMNQLEHHFLWCLGHVLP